MARITAAIIMDGGAAVAAYETARAAFLLDQAPRYGCDGQYGQDEAEPGRYYAEVWGTAENIGKLIAGLYHWHCIGNLTVDPEDAAERLELTTLFAALPIFDIA